MPIKATQWRRWATQLYIWISSFLSMTRWRSTLSEKVESKALITPPRTRLASTQSIQVQAKIFCKIVPIVTRDKILTPWLCSRVVPPKSNRTVRKGPKTRLTSVKDRLLANRITQRPILWIRASKSKEQIIQMHGSSFSLNTHHPLTVIFLNMTENNRLNKFTASKELSRIRFTSRGRRICLRLSKRLTGRNAHSPLKGRGAKVAEGLPRKTRWALSNLKIIIINHQLITLIFSWSNTIT